MLLVCKPGRRKDWIAGIVVVLTKTGELFVCSLPGSGVIVFWGSWSALWSRAYGVEWREADVRAKAE